MSESYNPLDVVGSPFFGLAETISNLPFIDQTGFQDWLYDSPLTQGTQNFRSAEPGWALGLDLATSLVPYVGWGAALNRAGMAANAGRGILGATNQARTMAAGLAPRNPGLAFALGETVAYAPPAAALTVFDLAGDRYESPWDALLGFGLGTIGGAGAQWAGHALSGVVQRHAPELIGGAWKAIFEPGPELQQLYGFSDNAQRAAASAARNPRVQQAVLPELEPQQRGAALWDLIRETEAGNHPDVDIDILRGQYDTEVRAILNRRLDPVEAAFNFQRPPSNDLRGAVDSLLRLTATPSGNRVRVPLTGSGRGLDNPEVLAQHLELPPGWVHDTDLAGLTQVNLPSADSLRRNVGLMPGESHPDFRQLERLTPGGRTQTWSVTQEADAGSYLLTTEVPSLPMPDIHRMTGRARYNHTRNLDKAEAARVFFSFKTTNPSKFFEGLRVDLDAADPGVIGRFEDRIPRGRSDFLDRLMDFRRVYLNKNTIRAGYKVRAEGPGGRERVAKEVLDGPVFGREIKQFFDTYTSPTDFQLKRSPEARAVMGLYQAAFDAAEGRARATLHGIASIPPEKNAISTLFSINEAISDENALAPTLRRLVQDDPNALELIRRVDNGEIPAMSLRGTPTGQWLLRALSTNETELNTIEGAINALKSAGATDARSIPFRKGHFGVSRQWDGSVFIPIYKPGALEPIAVRAGNGKAQATQKARAWAEHFGARDGISYRLGQPFIAGESTNVPGWLRPVALNPGLLEPRAGMRGYEYEFEPYKHVDELIARLEDGYVSRWRYAAGVISDALTGGKFNELRMRDPKAWDVVNTRIRQLKGVPGPIEERLNQITDTALAPFIGAKSSSKIAEGINELNFHLLHGVGQIATPVLNMTSLVQTQLPAGVEFLTSSSDELMAMGFQLPSFGPDGLPRPGFNWVSDPISLMWGGVKKASSSDPEVQEIYNQLFNKKVMGTGLANEYTGQDRTIAARASEGIRDGDDLAYWSRRLSSLLMSKTEQVSRTFAAGIGMQAMDMFEKAHGVRFTMDQKIANAARMVQLSNYGYFAADRPMMYTTPMGALFGNQKTWMTNYLFMQAHYFGLAGKGNLAPLLFSLGATTALGGVFAVPLLGMGIDAATEFLADKDGREFIYEQMGSGGNAISFGAPALFGMSVSGNVAAPASNLAHDTEFFFTIVALERAKLMGRALGRAWDDQVVLGMNPFKDEVFQRQLIQGFAPRSIYRTWEALTSDQLRSAATGYPMIEEFGLGARILHSLGFRTTEIAIQYEAYSDLLRNRDEMRRRVSLLGEAYANASMNNDREQMMEILQRATVMGVDINSVMRSSQVRMRNAGKDMFGRNFNEQQLEQYQETLRAGGR